MTIRRTEAERTLGAAVGELVRDAIATEVDAAVVRLAEKLRTLEPRAVPMEQAGELLGGLSVATVKRMVNRGELPRLPHTARVLIPVAAIDAYCDSACSNLSPVRAAS